MITDGLHASNSDEESWTNYAQRLEQCFAFKEVEAEKSVSNFALNGIENVQFTKRLGCTE